MVMRVVGTEAVATDVMKVVYENLTVNVETNSKKRRLLTFVVNSLVKNKNTEKNGTVFFERLRDRSAINYLVKITFSGIRSSIGIKKSDKLYRRYKKEANNAPRGNRSN